VNAPEQIKKWRETNDLSQKDAAQRVGCPPSSWCEWEHGDKCPDLDNAATLEDVTGVSMRSWVAFFRKKRAETASPRFRSTKRVKRNR
jgi:ribosome-binding protein aMBF1 (putative translation factor)